MREQTSASTTTVTGTKNLLVDVQKVVELLKNAPRSDEWMLVDPQGNVYQGKFEDVFPVMAAAHPLLKTPMDFRFVDE